MPKTLERTRKQIAKKRHGAIDALHEFSRDSKRLHKAQVRDDRLEKLIAARKKHDKPLIARVTYFQKVAQENENRPLDLEKIQNAINQFVRQDDEEYSAIKKARRPGRGPSAREDMLKMKIQALEKEQKNGFYMPDLSTQENINALSNWEGSWGGLASLSWIRLTNTGEVRPSAFPPSAQ
ncbi:translation machinery-associated protein 16 [Gnomoniopsis smithogilvyi]|uniref:Translation machinery-associated protein 16 n=1 Tax=Gnomoniopsis smithogilvyi TaxID=1191159 RepID=A0A9W8YLX9_9PEZI|nr:translation machinery-associated protein 16 [Gnomoniopsis smithogilvyi]